jgi:hypothetical protein
MIALLLIALVLGAAAFIRLAPSDPSVWHVAPDPGLWSDASPWGQVAKTATGATLRLRATDGKAMLARLDDVAMATPRTIRLAGSVEEGRITWVARSLLFGFPDYTTAEARADGVFIHARQRFGRGDWGVNAARLSDWLANL